MKKLAFVLCLSLLMLASVALADQTIQTEHFEADLSGNSARFGRYYVVNKTGALDFQEFDFEGYSEESMDAAPDFIIEVFKSAFVQNMADYGGNLRSEAMEIAGKPSALITFTGKNSTDDIYVGFTWGNEVICYMVYADTMGKTAKEDFIAILRTLRKIGEPAQTESQPFTLSDMTYQQLLELRKELNSEIVSRSEWKQAELPAGRWTVGTDIPAGEYYVSAAKGVNGGKFQVWGAAVGDYRTNGGIIYNQLVTSDSPLGKVILEDGYIVDTNIQIVLAPPMALDL